MAALSLQYTLAGHLLRPWQGGGLKWEVDHHACLLCADILCSDQPQFLPSIRRSRHSMAS
jgi:hypothetical protein